MRGGELREAAGRSGEAGVKVRVAGRGREEGMRRATGRKASMGLGVG